MELDLDEPQFNSPEPEQPTKPSIITPELKFNEPLSPELETLNIQKNPEQNPPVFFDPEKPKNSFFKKSPKKNVESLPPLERVMPLDPLTSYTTPRKHSKSSYEDDDFLSYEDNFPLPSEKVSKFLSFSASFSSFCLAIGFFIPLFALPISYNGFWSIFIFVSVHICILVAGFKSKSFTKFCYRNCRIIIRRQYVLFIQLLCIQTYQFSFAVSNIGMLVGTCFVLLGALFTAIGLLIWVIGMIKNRN